MMNSVSISAVSATRSVETMSMQRVIGAYLAEARSECLRYMRAPAFMLPIMLFPTMFYLLFGILMGRAGAMDTRYLLVSYGVFGVMSPGLFGFGVSLAMERDGGLLTYKRALPMPPGAYLLGKMLMAMMAAAVEILLLLALGLTLGHVTLSLSQAGMLLLTGVLGVLPFCALGMLIGTFIKGQGAPGLLNMVYLPMSFLSGLWMPLELLPKVLQQIAPIWPSYHLHQLGLAAMDMGQAGVMKHIVVLMGFAAVFFLLAARRLRRYG
jgi:ABC-2 type transport system permease protein